MISNIIFVLLVVGLFVIGYKGYSNGDRTPFFYKAIKVFAFIQVCFILLGIVDYFTQSSHREYTQLVDVIYRFVILFFSLALWGIPATGYFSSQIVEKIKLAFQED